MSKISGVLLDFDGVLSSIIVRLGWPFFHTLKIVKPKISKKEILYLLNEIINICLHIEQRNIMLVPKIMLKIAKKMGLHSFQLIRFIIFLWILIRKNSLNIHPEEKADDVLNFLIKNYKTALITHAEKKVIESAIKKFKYLKNIDLILTQNDLKHTKPNPEGLIKALTYLKLDPKKAIYIGDLPHDIEAGKRAGTLTCAVINFKEAALKKRELLEQFKPDFIINHIRDLPSLLLSIEKN